MSKWLINRRTLLISAFISILSEFPSMAAALPTLKLLKFTTSTAQFSISSPGSGVAYLEFGSRAGVYSGKSSTFTIKKGAASVVSLSGLKSGAKYYVRIRYRLSGKSFLVTRSYAFTTAASNLNSIFAIQADPHMDENSSSDIYNKTLDLISTSGAAFLIDLGDIFMVDKLSNKSEENIRARFELMKNYYSRLKNVPLKIVLGNHDGELGYSSFNTKKYRAEYFPEQTNELSYFSYVHNDVLHVALDPFTYTESNPKPDGWQWTLGKVQYDWLVKTLQNSKESHKFVYIHHLLVGDAQSRGGANIAAFNEWGGKNMDGTEGFEQSRPGWGKPIHQLLKEYGVKIVFKGHDHLYVKEVYDGIVYQTLPQPSHPGDATNSAFEYGYEGGKVVGGSGYLRVKTAPESVLVDFVKYDGNIVDSYTL